MDKKAETGRPPFMSAADLVVLEQQSEIARLQASSARLVSLLEQKEQKISELEWRLERHSEVSEETSRIRAENEKLSRELTRAQELNTYIRRAYEARARENEGHLDGFNSHLEKLEKAANAAVQAATAPAARPLAKSEADQLCEAYELKLSQLRAQKEEIRRQLEATQIVASRQETEVQWLRTEFRRLTKALEEAHASNGASRAEARLLQQTLDRAQNGASRRHDVGAHSEATEKKLNAAFNELAALQGELEQERRLSDEARSALARTRQLPDA